MRITVVGAGISGLRCATLLQSAGHEVSVLEKSRGASGRLSSKRTPHGSVDMGVQYLESNSKAFDAFLTAEVESGDIVDWSFDNSTNLHYLPIPRMSMMAKKMAETVTIKPQHRVESIQKKDKWLLHVESGDSVESDAVVLAVPAPQAVPLLDVIPEWKARVSTVSFLPTWTMIVSFESSLKTSIGAQKVSDGPLKWICNNSQKPGREKSVETWIMHASDEWSRLSVSLDKDRVGEALLRAFFHQLGCDPIEPIFSHVHRWLYAQPETNLGIPFLSDSALKMGVCGDWCLGDSVSHAFDSGAQLAKEILNKWG
ncbi:hypothetical protein DID77_03535 [Candidatus Marinamargulisbacteria bacterium SCGC AG-439-L15]|nr:hypothetical protein DID77_03535 [Candidatus Marinamargulisbacteria bacterium SCGC AG-439-L15]